MNRRLALKLLAATSLNEFACPSEARIENRIVELDCVDLIARIRDGSFRAEQVCASFLQQYERQQSLNVVTWLDKSNVLSRARDIDRARDKGARLPALAGLPVLVKDNIDTIGWPTSAGTASLKQNFPESNAPVIERLTQHGAIVVGKANMHELALGVTSSNPTFGFVHNPYKGDVIPGGSSGGSAAAVAARIVPAALGTDTAGSVRIPAAFCGCVGFRPSTYAQRLYSQQGVVPIVIELDTIGPMARSVSDIALIHATIVDEFPKRLRSLDKVRLGIPKSAYWDDLHPEIERVAHAALTRLRDQGAVLVEIDLRQVKEAAWQIAVALHSRMVADLESFLRTRVPPVSLRNLVQQIACPDVRAAIEKGRTAGLGPDLSNVLGAGRDGIRAAYRAAFRQHGIQALVFPTVVLPPPPMRLTCNDDNAAMVQLNGRLVPEPLTIVRNTLPTAAFGAPALSLPAGLTSSGLPVGLEFDGVPGDDGALLALGMAAEATIGRLPAPRCSLADS